MKKLMTLMLGLSLALGSVAVVFAQGKDTSKQDTAKKKAKKTKAPPKKDTSKKKA
jgi:uncharacterized membrane protein affecting hemolysin expression